MWWCFSKPEIRLHPDKTKTRPIIGKWSNKDINGNILSTYLLKGSLVSTQGFQGTICSVKDSKYAIRKINAEEDPDVKKAEESFQRLKMNCQLLHYKCESFPEFPKCRNRVCGEHLKRFNGRIYCHECIQEMNDKLNELREP